MPNRRKLYKELGNLFYAIAAADKKVRPEERKKMHEEILTEWKQYDSAKDRFGSDIAYIIEFEFETMEDNSVTAEKAFKLFECFFLENYVEIDNTCRMKIFNSARHIAESVRKINKSELHYLTRLKQLLKL